MRQRLMHGLQNSWKHGMDELMVFLVPTAGECDGDDDDEQARLAL